MDQIIDQHAASPAAPEAPQSSPPTAADSASLSAAPIIVVAGNKGGIGKSLVSLTVVERQQSAGLPTAIFETDDGTPDVHQCLKQDAADSRDTLRLERAELSSPSGWIELGSYAENNPQRCLVINTAAGANEAIAAHGPLLEQKAPRARPRASLSGLPRALKANRRRPAQRTGSAGSTTSAAKTSSP